MTCYIMSQGSGGTRDEPAAGYFMQRKMTPAQRKEGGREGKETEGGIGRRRRDEVNAENWRRRERERGRKVH